MICFSNDCLSKICLSEMICLAVVGRYNFHYLKNLLADKKKPVVAFRIAKLSLELSDIFPRCKVCVKTLLVFSNKL